MLVSANQSMIPGPPASNSTHTPMPSAPNTSQNGSYQVHDNTSFNNIDMSTPAAKEGLRAEGSTPVNTPCNKKQKSTAVHLTPAACKHLQDIAAQLWIIAHHQEYEPLAVHKFDQAHGSMPHDTKVRFEMSLCAALFA